MYRNELVSREKTEAGDIQVFLIFRDGVKAEGRVHRCVLTRKSIPSWLMVSSQAGTGLRELRAHLLPRCSYVITRRSGPMLAA